MSFLCTQAKRLQLSVAALPCIRACFSAWQPNRFFFSSLLRCLDTIENNRVSASAGVIMTCQSGPCMLIIKVPAGGL